MNTDKKFRTKFVAMTLGVALLGMVFGVVLSANLNGSETASAESLTALAAQASTASDLDSPFKAVYEEVNPSVVGIQLSTQRRAANGRISSDSAFVGSGVVIKDGYVVTNYHVVTAGTTQVASGISVMYNEEVYTAKYVAGDSDSDVAVLEVKDLPAPAVKLGNSDELSVGDWALVVGNPLGESLSNTLTVGVISGLDRDMSGSRVASTSPTMIQTNAAINSGNSGGGLFNVRGELVGITSMKMSSNGYYGVASIEGIGFAIPINTVIKIADDLIDYGKVVYPRMGVTIDIISGGKEEPSEDHLPSSVWITGVEEGSPAERAGLQVDDLVMWADGTRVTSPEELQAIVRSHEAGETVELKVYRIEGIGSVKVNEKIPEGEYLTFDVELELLDKTAE